jgi:hypothetical protein
MVDILPQIPDNFESERLTGAVDLWNSQMIPPEFTNGPVQKLCDSLSDLGSKRPPA